MPKEEEARLKRPRHTRLFASLPSTCARSLRSKRRLPLKRPTLRTRLELLRLTKLRPREKPIKRLCSRN